MHSLNKEKKYTFNLHQVDCDQKTTAALLYLGNDNSLNFFYFLYTMSKATSQQSQHLFLSLNIFKMK